MDTIKRLLDASAESASENVLTLANVKEWLRDYLQLQQEEATQFPETTRQGHWDLLAADYDHRRDAQFIAAVFSSTSVCFLSGLGPAEDVRAFHESSPDQVLKQLSTKFSCGEVLDIDTQDVINWVHSRH